LKYYIIVKFVHPLKIVSFKVVTDSGIVIDVKLVQFWKAYEPMLTSVVVLVNATLVNPEQPLNAYIPILVTFDGIVILFKEEQFVKTLSSIFVTDIGIVMFVRIEQL
jgi:hypothetical protein